MTLTTHHAFAFLGAFVNGYHGMRSLTVRRLAWQQSHMLNGVCHLRGQLTMPLFHSILFTFIMAQPVSALQKMLLDPNCCSMNRAVYPWSSTSFRIAGSVQEGEGVGCGFFGKP